MTANNNKKNTSRFFLGILSILITVVLFDFAIGSVLNHFYFTQKSGLEYRATYSIEKTTADILVFGTSRANHHYYPGIFEKKTGLSFYNVGRDAGSIFYDYGVLKGILARHNPKIIILDFGRSEFKKSQDNYDRLSFLLPYYKTHPEMRPVIEMKSPYEKIKLLSHIYPFNSSLFTIAIGNTKLGNKRSVDYNGYVPLKRFLDKPLPVDTLAVNYELDRNKIRIFESFVADCVRAKIKLYIVCSPYVTQFLHKDYSITIGEGIADKYNVKFFDLSQDSAFINNISLFADEEHLNDNGAKKFSDLLVDKMIGVKNTHSEMLSKK